MVSAQVRSRGIWCVLLCVVWNGPLDKSIAIACLDPGVIVWIWLEVSREEAAARRWFSVEVAQRRVPNVCALRSRLMPSVSDPTNDQRLFRDDHPGGNLLPSARAYSFFVGSGGAVDRPPLVVTLDKCAT